jgi:hypothetical protein
MSIAQLADLFTGGEDQMSVKIVLLFLFFITMAEAPDRKTQSPYACKYHDQPENCLNNSAVETYKTGDTYRLILLLGLNDQNITFNFECCAICDVCESLQLDSGTILLLLL